MKPFPIFCLALVVTVTLHAQQGTPPPSLPPLPPGPLLKRAPDYSTWTVTCQGHPIEEKAPVKSAITGEEQPKGKDAKEPVTMASTVIKTGSTILEMNTDTRGNRSEIWHLSGLMVMKLPDAAEPIVCPDSVQADIYSVNFAAADFAGLHWISEKTLTGIAKCNGRDCLVFNGIVSPLGARIRQEEAGGIAQAKALGQQAPDEMNVAAVAYIDLETRLPLLVTFGNEKRTYQYGTPPQAPLSLPKEMESALKIYLQRLKRLSAPAVRAY